MMWTIARKTVLVNIYDLRFTVSSALIVLLMGLSAVFFSMEIKERLEESRRLDNEARRRNSLEEVYAVRAPARLMFIAEGGEKYLPKAIKVTPWTVDHSFVTVTVKSLVPKFENIDWVYIVGILVSLMAMFFTYDAISGEKEGSLLSFTLSNPVKRSDLLFGVYLGTVVSFIPTMLLGVFVNLTILGLSTGGTFSRDNGLRIALAVVLSVFYVSLFVLIGILCSCLTHKSSVSLIASLLIWVLLTIVIPSSAGLVARTVQPIPSDKEIQDEIFRLKLEQSKGSLSSAMIEDILRKSGSRQQAKQQVEELENQLEDHYVEQQERLQKLTSAVLDEFSRKRDAQTELARWIARISPIALYQYALEELGGSGYAGHRAFLEEATRYMRRYSDYAKVARRQRRDQAAPMNMGAMSHEELTLVVVHSRSYVNVPVDPAVFPPFEAKQRPLAQSINRALYDILGLLLLNAACFLTALFKFHTYDVR